MVSFETVVVPPPPNDDSDNEKDEKIKELVDDPPCLWLGPWIHRNVGMELDAYFLFHQVSKGRSKKNCNTSP